MPEEKEVPDLLRQVSLAAQESRTRIKYFAPKEMKAGDFYWELPFEMRYSGPYHSVGYFFDGIRRTGEDRPGDELFPRGEGAGPKVRP